MKKEFTINLIDEDCIALEKKQYEFNALLSIIGYMAKDTIIDYENMQEEINEAEESGIALELEKAIIADKYCPEGYDSNDADWEANFHNSTIHYDFSKMKHYSGKTYTQKLTEEDINRLQLFQYEYNISLTLYTYLKESYNVNKEVLKEYKKVITKRNFDLEKTKNEISNKYKPDDVNLKTYDWSVDFIKGIIIYKEAIK